MDLLPALSHSSPIIADGSNGWLISQRLQPPKHEARRARIFAVLDAPELVHGIHCEYIAAGARCILTHTFEGNKSHLATFGEYDARALNIAAATLARDARSASGHDVVIAGSIGPLSFELRNSFYLIF